MSIFGNIVSAIFGHRSAAAATAAAGTATAPAASGTAGKPLTQGARNGRVT